MDQKSCDNCKMQELCKYVPVTSRYIEELSLLGWFIDDFVVHNFKKAMNNLIGVTCNKYISI